MQNFLQKLEMNMRNCKKKNNEIKKKLSCTNINIIFKMCLKDLIKNHHTRNH